MNKRLIRLTESDLHRIVKESVKRILRENDAAKAAGRKAAMTAKKAADAAADAAWAASAGAGYSKDNVKRLAGRKAADAVPHATADAARKAADAAARNPAQTARDAAKKAADAAWAAAAPCSASKKKNESAVRSGRMLTESKNSKHYRQKAIEVGRRTIGGNVPDQNIEQYVRDFEQKYLRGCSDYFYKFLPKFVELAFKTGETYRTVGEIANKLVFLSRDANLKGELEQINSARSAEDLRNIYMKIKSMEDKKWHENPNFNHYPQW